jgi:P-type conjugative transfer ATPase TrbB
MADPLRFSSRDEQVRRLAEIMRRQLGAFCWLLDEPDVVEIALNPDGQVWVDRLGQPMRPVGTMRPETAEALIATIASTFRTTVTRENPILECELPLDGSRFEGLIPPVVAAPVFAIRRRASAVFSLADYEAAGIMTAAQRRAIERAIAERRNILVTGGTASGKTTLLNALLAYMVEASPDDRLVIVEDTAELQCAAPNAVVMRATDTVSMQQQLRATMRLRPDRIIVGETRGGEALDLLKAWNTGHPGGVSTIHANHARAGLRRFELLILERTENPMPALIAEAVNVIVHIAKTAVSPGRRIEEVVAVTGLKGGDYQFEPMGDIA